MSVDEEMYEDVTRGGGNSRANRSGVQPAACRITPLNRLAFPKNKIPICELSGQPATVACTTPHVTLYYATEEQAEQAWHGTVDLISSVSLVLRLLLCPADWEPCHMGYSIAHGLKLSIQTVVDSDDAQHLPEDYYEYIVLSTLMCTIQALPIRTLLRLTCPRMY